MKPILGKRVNTFAAPVDLSTAIGLCVSRDLDIVPQRLIRRPKSGAGWNIAFVSACAILKAGVWREICRLAECCCGAKACLGRRQPSLGSHPTRRQSVDGHKSSEGWRGCIPRKRPVPPDVGLFKDISSSALLAVLPLHPCCPGLEFGGQEFEGSQPN